MEIDLNKIKTLKDAEEYGVPYFKVNTGKDDVIKAIKSDDGVARVRLIASSDAIDLVGDSFSQKALGQMESDAVGTTMFLNHSYSVPNDIFGIVEKATLVQKTFEIDGQTVKNIALVYDVKVAASNPAAVQTYNNILNEEARLGASVGVLVIDSKEMKSGINIIDSVAYMECSIVGQPCNRQCWVTGAIKTLKKMFPNQKKAVEVGEKPFDIKSIEPTEITAAGDEGQTMNKETAEVADKAVEAPVEIVKDAPKTAKGFYQDEYSETITDPYFLINVLCNGFWDMKCAAANGSLKPEEMEAQLGEGFDEFKSLAMPAFLATLQAMAEAGDDWYYYSFGMNNAMVKSITFKMAAQKSGKKISAETEKDLGVIHDKAAELMGLKCYKSADEAAEKSATEALATSDEASQSRVTELETANKEFENEITSLKSEIAKLQAEKSAIQVTADEWKASSFKLTGKILSMKDEPLNA